MSLELDTPKIISYPLGLGSNATDKFGAPSQFIMFSINAPSSGTRLREDADGGQAFVNSTREGIGVGAVIRTGNAMGNINAKAADPNYVESFGAEAVEKEKFLVQKGMSRINKTIALPIPDDYMVGARINYMQTDSTNLTKIGDMMNQEAGGVLSAIGNSLKNKAIATVLTKSLTNEAALKYEDRRVDISKKDYLFTGIGRRDYTFNFKFAPKNEKESAVVDDIIETFRYYSLPEVHSSRMFYILPGEFNIEFIYGSKINPKIPRIATSACTSVNVNYSPTGVWATMPDGSPVYKTMSVSFTELELIDRTRVYTKDRPIISGY